MLKVTTSNNRTVYVSPKALQTAELFKHNEKDEYWVRLNYGKYDNTNKQSATIVGPFLTMEQAEKVIVSLN